MTQYTFELSVKSVSNHYDIYSYSLDLNLAQENNPQQFFTPEIQTAIRNQFQTDSGCLINDYHLGVIVETWLGDIQEGFRRTCLTLDLPSILQANASNIQESGNSELPPLMPPNLSDIEPLIGALPPLIFH